jgi:hypothetical protein
VAFLLMSCVKLVLVIKGVHQRIPYFTHLYHHVDRKFNLNLISCIVRYLGQSIGCKMTLIFFLKLIESLNNIVLARGIYQLKLVTRYRVAYLVQSRVGYYLKYPFHSISWSPNKCIWGKVVEFHECMY